jgi:hypothetical protein
LVSGCEDDFEKHCVIEPFGETNMIAADQAAVNLAVATVLSATIGFERQWRQRLAGLRTNSLVAIGATSFVIFASLIPGEASPTRAAAQVVSGIGFLGAGLIFREGMSVRGLNTAATLWCSARSAFSRGPAIRISMFLVGRIVAIAHRTHHSQRRERRLQYIPYLWAALMWGLHLQEQY